MTLVDLKTCKVHFSVEGMWLLIFLNLNDGLIDRLDLNADS